MNLAWKEIKQNKSKYLLIEVIIVLLIFMVIFLSGLANGLARAVSSGIENTEATYFIVSEDASDVITVSKLETSLLDQIANETESEIASLDVLRMNLNSEESNTKYDITYFSIDPEGFMNPEVIEGENLGMESNQIVLDQSYEDEDIQIGDIVEDSSTGIEMTVVGFTKDHTYGHVAVGYISISTYTEIRTAINPIYDPYYQTIAIKGDQIENIQTDGVEIVTMDSIVENLPGYASEQSTIQMILWVLVVVSGAILGVFFYVLTIQKLKQFGILKAIGMRMSEITAILLSQIFLLAMGGVIIGNLLSFGMAALLPDSMPFYLVTTDVILVSGVFVVIAIICSLLSIQKVAKVDPIIMIGENE